MKRKQKNLLRIYNQLIKLRKSLPFQRKMLKQLLPNHLDSTQVLLVLKVKINHSKRMPKKLKLMSLKPVNQMKKHPKRIPNQTLKMMQNLNKILLKLMKQNLPLSLKNLRNLKRLKQLPRQKNQFQSQRQNLKNLKLQPRQKNQPQSQRQNLKHLKNQKKNQRFKQHAHRQVLQVSFAPHQTQNWFHGLMVTSKVTIKLVIP